MERTPQGVKIQGRLLPQQPILSNMTRSDITFSLLVEEMFNYIKQPEYRQIVVEVFKQNILNGRFSHPLCRVVILHRFDNSTAESRAPF